MPSSSLHALFAAAAVRNAAQTAVVEAGRGSITYGALSELAGRLHAHLNSAGVRPGDRVGIYLRKSIDAVAAICGILRAGAAYVPVDPAAPPARNAFIMNNCAVRALVIEERFVEKFREEISQLGVAPPMLILPGAGAGEPLARALEHAGASAALRPSDAVISGADDLAYILYTSGSTGKPKGVMLSHENAVSFVDWCSEVFEPQASDRFSSHAPFHFDLSILDIHVALKHGATLVLVPEDRGKDPQHLAQFIADERITIWYSAPSILSLLAQFGNLADHDCSALRHVLFAGEVFPVKHLRALHALLPKPRYFNLYGPTETNVCTFYEIPSVIPVDRTTPFPIGKACSHLACRVIDDEGREVARGAEGELCVSGRGVMRGYWDLPEQSAKAFVVEGSGTRWYRTGDIVVEDADGNYVYRGRRDRMVKRRGYRVELGEIEAGLYRHPLIKEAAVVALPDEEAGVKVTAHLSCREDKRPSLIELKRFCAEHLPLYMVPDRFSWHDALPKTSTDKIDYQRLKAMD